MRGTLFKYDFKFVKTQSFTLIENSQPTNKAIRKFMKIFKSLSCETSRKWKPTVSRVTVVQFFFFSSFNDKLREG